jgi:hypothetical protein
MLNLLNVSLDFGFVMNVKFVHKMGAWNAAIELYRQLQNKFGSACSNERLSCQDKSQSLIAVGFFTHLVPFLFVTVLALPSAASAQCYAVYDEAYRSMFKNSFHVQLPSRAGNFSSMAECRSMVDQMLADPQYHYDAGLNRTQCVCDGGEGGSAGASGGYAQSGGSLQQQIVTMAVSSLLNALLSGINAPEGADGDATRQKIQEQWDEEEAARKVAEKKRLDDAFNTAQQDATAFFGNRPSGMGGGAVQAPEPANDGAVYLGTGSIPSLLRSSGAVSEAEWAQARAWQTRIDALRDKGILTAAEAKELASLEAKRNALWKRAVSVPGLTQRDRDALRLKLYVVDSGAVAASIDDLMEARETASKNPKEVPTGVISTMTEASLTFGIQTAIETAGEEKMGNIADAFVGEEKKVTKFGNALFLADAGAAVVSGKPEKTAEPAVTWVSGKLVEKAPWLGFRVGMAQGVSAVTTSVERNAFEQIVETSGKIVPGFLPPGMTGKEWWESMKSELALPQKFGMEGYGQ